MHYLQTDINPWSFLFVFICSLFNHVFQWLKTVVSNEWMMVNNESEWMCKQTVMAYFKVLSWHLPGRTKGTNKKISGRIVAQVRKITACANWLSFGVFLVDKAN
jgi:hypothetical protein